MKLYNKWITAIFVLAISLSLSACNDFSSGSAGSDLAKVDQVEVVSASGFPTKYFAVASGVLPDECTQLGRARQRVVATTIRVTLPTESAEETCPRLATVPFAERIRLRVNGLSAGSYTVEVNGVVASIFLTEDQ
mgnify:CR=1 FL=1